MTTPEFGSPFPVERLTALGSEVISALENSALYRMGDRVIVMVHGTGDNIGGMAIQGYDTEEDILTDIKAFFSKMMEATGRHVVFVEQSRN